MKHPRNVVRPRRCGLRHATACCIGMAILFGITAIGAELTPYLHSPDPAVRRRALERLACSREPHADEAAIAALRDPEPTVRAAAAATLAARRDTRATEALTAAVNDDDANVRFQAVHALSMLANTNTIPTLIRALHDPEWCVRGEAMGGLHTMHAPASVLLPLLADTNVALATAQWLLRELPPRQVAGAAGVLLERADATTRLRAVAVLAALDDEDSALSPLANALDDTETAVRRAAVAGIARTADTRVPKLLAARLAREDNPTVRGAISAALNGRASLLRLAGHWTFDDGNKTTAADSTGGGTDGAIKGAVAYTPGKLGRALQLKDGAFVELGKAAALPIANSELTVTAWIRTDAPEGVVVARGGAFCGFSLYVKDGAARFGIHRVQDGPTYLAVGKRKVVGDWVHLAGVVRTQRIDLFVNGKLEATAKTPGPIPGNTGQGMEIGFDAGNSPAEITTAFNGLIDDVKVYLTALSSEDIAMEYERGGE